jgi:hypothetical protein
MPDDVTTDHAPETDLEEEEVVLVHDDIVKRLLDYQRQLREADESTGPEQEASVTAVGTVVELEEIVDLTVVETELEATEDVMVEQGVPTRADGAGDRDAEVIDIWSDRSDGADAAAAELAVVPDEPALETFGATSASEPTPEMSGVEASVTPAEVEARIERIEASLERLSDRFAELRSSFQDMAIAADERLAEIDQLIADIRRER